MPIVGLDHLVIVMTDEAATRRFYVDGLGLAWVQFGAGRAALQAGRQKINLHRRPDEMELRAAVPTVGAGDFCLLTDEEPVAVAARMAALGYPAIAGPMRQTGAVGPITSFYFRDPDGNLVEVARQL